MEPSTVTLTIGLAGIVSTLSVSALGLYYTAKSRAAPLRQALFSKQIEIVMEVANLQSRIRTYATILADEGSPHLEEARRDIGDYFKQFAEAEEKAAVLLPVKLWIEVKRLSDEIINAIIEFDSQGLISNKRMKTMVARMAKVALLCRMVVGSDELTEQSISLFSSQTAYSNIADKKISDFEDMHTKVNGKAARD